MLQIIEGYEPCFGRVLTHEDTVMTEEGGWVAYILVAMDEGTWESQPVAYHQKLYASLRESDHFETIRLRGWHLQQDQLGFPVENNTIRFLKSCTHDEESKIFLQWPNTNDQVTVTYHHAFVEENGSIDGILTSVQRLVPLEFPHPVAGENWIYWYLDHLFEASPTLTPEEFDLLARAEIRKAELRRDQEAQAARSAKEQALLNARRVLDGHETEEVAGPRRKVIPRETQIFVWQRDGGRCVECGSNERLEYDHIIPLSLGGSDTARNLQLLCELCNRRKGARIGA